MHNCRRVLVVFLMAGFLASAGMAAAQDVDTLLPPSDTSDNSGLPTWLACFTAAVAAPTCSGGCAAGYNQCKRDYPDKQQCCEDAADQCQNACQSDDGGWDR